jgi:quercetin dioxygenase-like cupin family protein
MALATCFLIRLTALSSRSGTRAAAFPRSCSCTKSVGLARHALTGVLEGFEAVLLELNLQPGQGGSGPGHRHPGPVLGYVAEGRLRFAINHEPEQVVPAGGTFFEPSGDIHTTHGSASSDIATRVLVFMMVPKSSPLTAPA